MHVVPVAVALGVTLSTTDALAQPADGGPSLWPAPRIMRHVRLEGPRFTVYLVPPELAGERSIDPALLTVICTRPPCDLWLPDGIDLAIRRPGQPRARAGLRLPDGPGIALLSANPAGKRTAGFLVLGATIALAAFWIYWGTLLELDPLVGVGAAVGFLGLVLSTALLMRAGRPRAKWFPGHPATLPGRLGGVPAW